ncbi:MAG: caspase family protein [Haliangium ochraceum]
MIRQRRSRFPVTVLRLVALRVLFAAAIAAAMAWVAGSRARAAEVAVPVANANANERTVVRRFALITGASQGGRDRVRLRFAASDARAIRHVLSDLGGLSEGDTVLMLDVGRAQMRAGFDRMKQLIAATRAPGARSEMIFYYSGHSDESGLLLGAERVDYAEVRAWVEETGADVRIAVLDSCASGALTRGKGGVHRPPFLVDKSSAARGHAYLTASAENETAQESDRLGAAYFTHYLVSGLRGAADVSHDGRVTLSEAYQYAFTETLARTEASRGGPQHASYDFQLAGKGDLVMTDLRATSASLVLPPEMSGRLFVRDAQGQLIAEVHKLPAQPIELGLPPGRYRVTLDDDRRLSEATVDLGAGRSNVLGPSAFVAMVAAATTSRGTAAGTAAGTTGTTGTADPATGLWLRQNPEPTETVPVNLSIFPGFDTVGGRATDNAFVAGFFARSANLRGFSLTLGHHTLHDVRGTAIAAIGNANGGDTWGARVGGVGNLSRGDSHGIAIGGVGNLTFGAVTGLQLGGSINWAGGRLRGGQVGGAFNAAGGGYGYQIAGAANAVKSDFDGLQLAGGANVSYRGSRSRGLQLAGGANIADTFQGTQIAVFNFGGDVTGAQVGVVNIARKVRGAQIGVVNVAEDMDGASFGLVTFVRNGIHDLDLSVSEVGAPILSGVLGARHFYTRLGVGLLAGPSDIPGGRDVVSRSEADRKHYLMVWGFGGRLYLQDRFTVDVEAMGTQYFPTNVFDGNEAENAVTGSLRIIAAVRLAANLRIIFGPTYNVAVGWNGTDLVTGSGFAEAVPTSTSGGTTVRMYPGFMAGLRI